MLKIKNMLKNLFCFLFIAVTFGVFLMMGSAPIQAKGNPKYASIVVDAESGQVISERYADKYLHPASLTKMMTLYLMFDAIESGRWSPSTRLYVSEKAQMQPPSKLGVKEGSRITVRDAIRALVVKSANDVALVVAENYAGSEYRFAKIMTQKAKELGMSRTVFKNASGLPNDSQVSTARDMASLSIALMRDFPGYYHLFSLPSFTYKGVTYRSHNKLMKHYKGMDGLKTGYINDSGFNLASSAVRDNRRLVGIVFGGRTSSSRNKHMASLLNRGFALARQGTYKDINIANTPPLPKQKPITAMAMAEMDTTLDVIDDEEQEELTMAIYGQGSADTEIPPPLIPLVPQKPILQKVAFQPKIQGDWSIQVGAFYSRMKSDFAIRDAQRKLGGLLDSALKRSVPTKDRKGRNVFRARLTGLEQTMAFKACKQLNDCMVIAPQ